MHRREAPLPLYYQVELRLRQAIESGEYKPGERLPRERDLQEQFAVSRVTIRSALRRLEEEGLISTQRGRGTFITAQAADATRIERHTARLHSFEDDLIIQAGPPRIDLLAFELCFAPPRINRLLEISPGTEVTRIRRLGWVGDEPLWLESRYLVPALQGVFNEEDALNPSFTKRLEAELGTIADQSRLRITAASATADQAKELQIRSGDPVLINEFVVMQANRPLEASRAIFRADRYAFTVDVLNRDEDNDSLLSSLQLGSSGAFGIVSQEVSS